MEVSVFNGRCIQLFKNSNEGLLQSSIQVKENKLVVTQGIVKNLSLRVNEKEFQNKREATKNAIILIGNLKLDDFKFKS